MTQKVDKEMEVGVERSMGIRNSQWSLSEASRCSMVSSRRGT